MTSTGKTRSKKCLSKGQERADPKVNGSTDFWERKNNPECIVSFPRCHINGII